MTAQAFRWDYTATKSQDSRVVKWKTDNWTGQQWVEIYSVARFHERPIGGDLYFIKEKAWDKRNSFANYWKGAIGLILIWLVIAIKRKGNPTESQFNNNQESANKNICSPQSINEKNIDNYILMGTKLLINKETRYSQWATKMVQEFGEQINPHLKDTYAKARELHGRYVNGDRETISLVNLNIPKKG